MFLRALLRTRRRVGDMLRLKAMSSARVFLPFLHPSYAVPALDVSPLLPIHASLQRPLIYMEDIRQANAQALAYVRKESLDIFNRLHSILEDVRFVERVCEAYPGLPVIRTYFRPCHVCTLDLSFARIANLRCGAWYVDPAIVSPLHPFPTPRRFPYPHSVMPHRRLHKRRTSSLPTVTSVTGASTSVGPTSISSPLSTQPQTRTRTTPQPPPGDSFLSTRHARASGCPMHSRRRCQYGVRCSIARLHEHIPSRRRVGSGTRSCTALQEQ